MSVGFFDLVFFAVLVSTVVQGRTVEWLAGRLGLGAGQATSERAQSSG
jgi:NhaP-type Na+/H+ and K+/H+ antiporter